MKIKRILLPIDLGSDNGDVISYAFAVSRSYEAELVLLHCESGSQMTADQKSAKLDKTLSAQIKSSDLSSLHWRSHIVATADVEQEIIHRAATEHADLIIMRSRRRPHRAALLGSTTEAVCRTAPCPVLVMHSDERQPVNGLRINLKKILVAYDFSDYAELALNNALAFAQEYQAELHLLHVLPPRSVNEPEIAWYPIQAESAYHQTACRLQRAVPPEAHLWCTIKQIVTEGAVYREILKYAENNDVDLITMGAHGAGFGMRALFGSNVDRVLRQARCPVLVARPLMPVPHGELATSDYSVTTING